MPSQPNNPSTTEEAVSGRLDAPQPSNGARDAEAAHRGSGGRVAASVADGHWRLEMQDGDQWIPVGVPCTSREDAEHLLYLRGGTGLTYRITPPTPARREETA